MGWGVGWGGWGGGGGLVEGEDGSVEAAGARDRQYYTLGTNLKYERRGPCLRSRKWQLVSCRRC